MELGLSLGETMADAGRDLVLGLGMGVGEAETGRTEREVRKELEFGAGRCGRSSPEPAVRLTLLPGLVPSLGLPWPPPSETTSEYSMHAPSRCVGFRFLPFWRARRSLKWRLAFGRAFGGVDARVRREPGAVAVRRRRGGGGRRGAGRRGRRRGGRVVVPQQQRGLLPHRLLRAGPRRPRRRRRPRGLPRQRRGRRRLGAQEAAPLQGAVGVPRGELQGARHAQPEAEAGAGEAAQPPAAAGGGVVSEPQSQDEAEADGGGLRVPEALLRDAHRGEPAAAEGAGGAAGAQDGAPLLHAPPGYHPLHVPLLRARRLQLRPRRAGAGAGLGLVPLPSRRRHCCGPAGAEALIVRRAVLVPPQPPAGRPSSATGAGELVRPPSSYRSLTSCEVNEGPVCKYAHFVFPPLLLFFVFTSCGFFLFGLPTGLPV